MTTITYLFKHICCEALMYRLENRTLRVNYCNFVAESKNENLNNAPDLGPISSSVECWYIVKPKPHEKSTRIPH